MDETEAGGAGGAHSLEVAYLLSRVRQIVVRAESAAEDAREIELMLANGAELDLVQRRLSQFRHRLVAVTSLVRNTADHASTLKRAPEVEAEAPPALPPVAVDPPLPSIRAWGPKEDLEPAPSLRERLEAKGLLGARGLALVGAAVTILGLVLLIGFSGGGGGGNVLGPGMVTAIGAGVSTLAVVLGVLLRRRFGQNHATLAVTGVGIAGGYGTLLAANVLYDLVPDWLGLVLASAIAVLGAALAIAWRSQTVAMIGLVGAICVPGLATIGTAPAILGTSYVAVVLAAALALAVRERWPWLLVSAVAASAPQLLLLVALPPAGRSGAAMALACLFGTTYLGAGIARQRLEAREALDPLASVLVTWPAALVGWSGYRLLGGDLLGLDSLGVLLLVTALAYAGLAAAFFARERGRQLSILLAAVAFTLGAIGTAQFLGGATLAVVWALEAGVLAWLALHVDEPRFRLAAVAYLGLAVVHAIAFEAPPRLLYEPTRHPAAKLWAIAATAIVAFVFALIVRRWPPIDAVARRFPLLQWAEDVARRALTAARRASLLPGGVLALYAVSLAVLQIGYSSRIGSFIGRFEWGHVLAGAVWAYVGLALVIVSPRPRSLPRVAGSGLLGLALVDLVAYQQAQFPVSIWAVSALLLAAAYCALGLVEGLRSARDPGLVGAVSLVVSASLATAAVAELADARQTRGLALLGLAALAAALSAAVFPRRRNLATVLWLEALAFALAALPHLLHGEGLVAVLAAASIGTILLAARAREPRLRLAALAPLVGALAVTLSTLATPRELFVESQRLWHGLIALALVLGALAFVAVTRPAMPERPDRFDLALTRAQPRFELAADWTFALLALYGLSIGVLQVAQSVGHRTPHRQFQIDRTALTGVWAVIGAALVIHGGSVRRLSLRAFGYAALWYAVVDAVAFEALHFPRSDWGSAAFLLAIACCAAGVVDGLRADRDPEGAAVVALVASAGLAAAAVVAVVHGTHARALALLGLALVPAALSVAVFPRRRNLATVLWLEALILALAALPQLLHGLGLVAALSAGSVGIALLGARALEPRLQLAALAPLAGAFGVTFVTLATPRELFVETHRLWDGLVALVLVLSALAALLVLARPAEPQWPDEFDSALVRAHSKFELAAVWMLAFLALDAASTGVLQVVTSIGATYQSGQAALSTVWSLIALGALTLGLVRDHPIIRLTGFAMIALTLAKIFFYDLASLSAVARALSFLAVGAVLLVSGFFYQRLTNRQEGPKEPAPVPPAPQ